MFDEDYGWDDLDEELQWINIQTLTRREIKKILMIFGVGNE